MDLIIRYSKLLLLLFFNQNNKCAGIIYINFLVSGKNNQKINLTII